MRNALVTAALFIALIPTAHAQQLDQQTLLNDIEIGMIRTAIQERAEHAKPAQQIQQEAKPVILEPNVSARRVFLLCASEDPECVPLIRKANEDFLDHPYMIYGDTFYRCKVTATNQNPLDVTFTRFMQQIAHIPSLGDWTPWQVVYLTYSMYGGPCSP